MKNPIAMIAVTARIVGAAGIAVVMLNCQAPIDRPDTATDQVEFESVWQYLRAFSIHQGAVPPDPFVFPTPDSMMAVLHDTLKGNPYTHYYYEEYVPEDSVSAATAYAAASGNPTVFLDRLTDSTACITITSFDERTWKDFKTAAIKAAEYPEIIKIIIDLRQNRGGQLDVLDSIIAALVPLGTRYIQDSSRVYDKASKKYKTTGYHALTTEKELLMPWFGGKNKKYVVIMDSLTASASEILCAALYEGCGAKLIGTRSYGKAMGQIILDRRTRQPLQITFLNLKGVSSRIGDYHRVGITPDAVPVSIKAAADTTWSQWKKELFYALKMLEPGVMANSAIPFHAPHINASPSKMAASGLYRVIKEEDVWQ